MASSFFARVKKTAVWKHLLVSAVFLYLQQFQLTFSLYGDAALFGMDPGWVLLNILIVSVPFLLVFFFVRRLDLTVLLSAVTITVLSVANHHVLAYHGSPFLPRIFSASGRL